MQDELPPLNALRAFEGTARRLSMSSAAKEMHVTPGAVSRQIRLLEEFLGHALFDRSRREIALTPHGQRYFETITASFKQIRETTGRIRTVAKCSPLKIRAYTTFAMQWLIPRLSSFHAEHPAIEVVLSASLDPVDFRRDDLDGAIRLGNGYWPGLTASPLVENILVPVCSPALPAKNALSKPADLAQHLLLHSAAHERSNDWVDWLKIAGVSGVVDAYAGLKYENSAMAYQAAREGQGLAMAQLALIEKDVTAGRLVIPFAERLDRGAFTYYLLTPDDRPASKPMQRFREWLLAQAGLTEGPEMSGKFISAYPASAAKRAGIITLASAKADSADSRRPSTGK